MTVLLKIGASKFIRSGVPLDYWCNLGSHLVYTEYVTMLDGLTRICNDCIQQLHEAIERENYGISR